MISTVESMASPRNKYNTLTAGEAKKLSKFLSHRQPTRTASVLHKPRPPPMVVTDLDTVAPKPAPLATTATFTTLANTSGLQTKSQLQKQNGATATVRSSSSCSNHSYRGHRHSMNFGPNYVANNRYATLNAFTKYNYGMSDQNNKSSTLKSSPNDSESNLSFRSSLDIVDSAYGSDRIQTLSVDLGKPAQHYNNNNYRLTNNNQFVTKFPQKPAACYDNHNHQQQHEQQSNKISDESFSSAKSHQSESAKQKSLSKTSLSTSTSRVFQNQLCSLKKFFRYMPIRRSYVSNNSDNQKQHSTTTQSDNYPPSIQSSSLEESLSQLFLNRSQSPPICPPPPGELKSMSYMENSVNYSNYDEFTRARNKQASLLLGRSNNQQQSSQKDRDDFNPDYSPNGFVASEYDEGNSWQLTSLPISYERNLTTVFEEKLNSLDTTIRGFRDKDNNNATIYNNNNNNTKKEKHLIKPPDNFEDKVQISFNHPISNGSSSQSLASVTTADSILDFHRQTATSFRFSYARPSSFDRAPANQGLPLKVPLYDQTKQGTSTGGSSSNSSLTNNGIDNPDQSHAKISPLIDKASSFGYKTATEIDTTLTSDTSTLHGDDTETLTHKKRCAELELELTNLGNKLSTKDKELRELQLKMWSSDYLIDQLKSSISRLEKENAQLKAMVISSGANRAYL